MSECWEGGGVFGLLRAEIVSCVNGSSIFPSMEPGQGVRALEVTMYSAWVSVEFTSPLLSLTLKGLSATLGEQQRVGF